MSLPRPCVPWFRVLLAFLAVRAVAAPLDESALRAALVSKNFAGAVALAKDAVEAGDPAGIEALGELHYKGLGVEKDLGQARQLFLKAARLGNVEARYRIAFMCRKGEGGPKTPNDAVNWYRRAAGKGHAKAAYELASMYEAGDGVEHSDEEMWRWHGIAANLGHPISEYKLGNAYYAGEGGLNRDINQAMAWLEKSAAQDYAEAQNDLGVLLETGQGVSKNLDRAFAWYEKAAAQGNARATIGLTRLLLDHHDGREDFARAVRLLLPLAKAGNAAAALQLGHTYLEAGQFDNIKRNPKEALKWYGVAAEAGQIDAFACVGLAYEKGNGVSRDYKEAFKWYQRGAEKSDPWCTNNLGVLYLHGWGVPANEDLALEWFQKAGRLGNQSAPADAGDILAGRNQWGEALKWYALAVENGNGVTARFLGDLYNRDNDSCRWDNPDTALQWYEKGASLGNGDCMRRAGRVNFTLRNYVKAAHYFRLAKWKAYITDGDKDLYAWCENYLGNHSEAAKLVKELAESTSAGKYGDSHYKQELAEMYAKGLGVPQDPAEARRLLASAELGDSFYEIDRQSAEAEAARRDELNRHPKSTWDSGATNTAPCPICGGTGMHDGITCQTCGGQGKVHVEK